MSTWQDNSTDQKQRIPLGHSKSLWRNRDYILLWSGQALSDIGGAVSELAFPLLVLAVSHSPAQAGFVAALRALPATFFSLFAGVLVDRWDRKRVMLVCDTSRAVSLASIPIAFSLGLLTIWQLYITAFLEGSLMIVFALAKTAAMSQVVSTAQLTTAVAQEEFVEGTTALVGPPLSGVLYTLGMMLPFIADAISYIISIVTMLVMNTPFQREHASTRRKIWSEITVGVLWVQHQPFILTMTLLMGTGAFIFSGNVLIGYYPGTTTACFCGSDWPDLRLWRHWFNSRIIAGSPPGTSFDSWAIHPAVSLVYCAELALLCAYAIPACARCD